MPRPLAIAALLSVLLASAFGAPSAQACAAHHSMGHGHKGHAAHAEGTASTQAYQRAMAEMHRNMAQPLSGNPDVDYVRQMIPHHQAAVEMAQIQLAYGTDEGLKDFSRWIIVAQAQEIGFMQNWLRGRDNGLEQPGARDYYGAAMEKMHHGMMIEYSGDADADFVRGMIAHHQGAVDMSAILFAVGHNPEIRALAENIYRSQHYEIAWQRHWLQHRQASVSFPSFIL
jgi:uncharacterized protein (DUF305 family)